VRAHKSAENAGDVGPKFLEALKKKLLEILAERFRFLLRRAHKRGCVGFADSRPGGVDQVCEVVGC
jgi:hypothetical protein